MRRRPLAHFCVRALVGACLFALGGPARADSPYTWAAGPPSDPNWFMLGVWYQSYSTTRLNEYQSIGLTNYICPTTPTNTNLSNLRSRGMKVMTTYSSGLLSLSNAGVIDGWIQMDEPDNAQADPNYTDPNHRVWGPCVNPNVIIARYNTWKAADPNRPVYLGLGQGVCWPYSQPYYGRGSGSTWAQYPLYCQGADIVTFDVYPYNARSTDPPYQNPWYVAVGVDRLRAWTNYEKPIWVHIETTHISGSGRGGPKPYQTKAEVWMALIHGAAGIDYFSHSWVDGFHEDGIFSTDPNVVDPNMPGMLAVLNAQIKSLAPQLYTADKSHVLDCNLPVNWCLREYDGQTWLFAVGMRDSNAAAYRNYQFQLADMPASIQAEVLGEGRSVTLVNGAFQDDFSNLAVHLYRIPVPEPGTAALLVGGAAWLLRWRLRRRA